tara:strand:- start:180 stop:1031 length:852 start_codon:yes stop_codon:yes gene_type:complete
MTNINKKIEVEYNLRTRHPNFEEYFTEWRDLSKKAREKLVCEIDIDYGTGLSMQLDLFPAQGKNNPLLIFIHGGYWRSLDKSDHSFPALSFVRENISLASINYALAPSVKIEQIVEQCSHAVEWLFNNPSRANADASNIHVCGHSAGGHLAAMMLSTEWAQFGLPERLIKSCSAISGVFDLRPILSTSINEDLKMDESTAILNSPALQTPKYKAPLLVAVGMEESQAFIEQSKNFSAICEQAGHRSNYIEVAGTNHFNVVTSLASNTHFLTKAILNNILCESL